MRVKAKVLLVRVIAVVVPVAPPKTKYPDLNLVHYISFCIVETELRDFFVGVPFLYCV